MAAILPNVSITMSDTETQSDDNVIDFIQYKMLRMADEYAKVNQMDMAEACWNALEKYMAGEIDIYFKSGEPYVTKLPNDFEWFDDPSEKK